MTPQLYALAAKSRAFFGRHHPIIYIVVAGLLSAFALLSLYGVLVADSSPTTSGTISGFDEKTIQEIKVLHDSSGGQSTITLPSPRPNPFVE